MSSIVLTNAKKIVKYFAYFILTSISLYIGTLLLQCIFNLGTHLGNYIRCIYSTFVQ
jgi:hypothetical protein